MLIRKVLPMFNPPRGMKRREIQKRRATGTSCLYSSFASSHIGNICISQPWDLDELIEIPN